MQPDLYLTRASCSAQGCNAARQYDRFRLRAVVVGRQGLHSFTTREGSAPSNGKGHGYNAHRRILCDRQAYCFTIQRSDHVLVLMYRTHAAPALVSQGKSRGESRKPCDHASSVRYLHIASISIHCQEPATGIQLRIG